MVKPFYGGQGVGLPVPTEPVAQAPLSPPAALTDEEKERKALADSNPGSWIPTQDQWVALGPEKQKLAVTSGPHLAPGAGIVPQGYTGIQVPRSYYSLGSDPNRPIPPVKEALERPSGKETVNPTVLTKKTVEVSTGDTAGPLSQMAAQRAATGAPGALVVQPGKETLESRAVEEPTPGASEWAAARQAEIDKKLGTEVPQYPTKTVGGPTESQSFWQRQIDTINKLEELGTLDPAIAEKRRAVAQQHMGEIAPQVQVTEEGPPTMVHQPGTVEKVRDADLLTVEGQKKIQAGLIGNQENLIKELSATIPDIKEKLDMVDKELELSRQELKDSEIKPWYKKDAGSILSYVMGAIGAAAGAFASGFSHGKIPNFAGQIFMKKIEMEENAQKAKIAKLLKIHGLTEKQRSYLKKEYDDYKDKKRLAVLNLAQLKLGSILLEAQPEKIKSAAIDVMIGLRQQKADIELKRRAAEAPPGKVTTKEQLYKPQVVQLKDAGAKSKEAGTAPSGVLDRRNFMASLDGLKELDVLIKSYQGNKPWNIPLISRLGPATNRYRADRNRAMMKYVKAMSGVQFSAKELEMHKASWASGTGLTELGQKEGMYKLNQLREDILNRIVTQLQTYPDLSNVALKSSYKRDIEKQLQEQGGSVELGPVGGSKKKVMSSSTQYGAYVDKYSGNIDPRVVYSRIQLESGGNPNTTAKAQKWKTGFGSEIGLLQMSPDTRKQYGISDEQAKDPETNIRVQMKQWNSWTDKFFGNNPPTDKVAYNTWAWLVTAVGPGAAAKIRQLAGNRYDLYKLRQVAHNMDELKKNRSYWGSQSPEKISQRINTAISSVSGAMEQ